MKIVIQFTRREELRALPIIYRHSPAVVLRDQTYVLSEGAVIALKNAGVKFKELSRDTNLPSSGEVAASERI